MVKRRNERPHAQLLRDHFATEAADAGLRSAHGALVEMVVCGIPAGGRASYDGAMGARIDNQHMDHRRVRRTLLMLSGPHQAVLVAVYGARKRLAQETMDSLSQLGSEAPAALLTSAAVSGFEAKLRRAARRAARGHAADVEASPGVRSALDLRVDVAVDKAARGGLERFLQEADAQVVSAVVEEARALMVAAHKAFAAAWGPEAEEDKPEPPRRQRAPKQAEAFAPRWA